MSSAMSTSAPVSMRARRRNYLELLELRRESLDLTLIGAVVLAGLVMLVPDPYLIEDIVPTGRIALCLLASAAMALSLRERWFTVSAVALITGLGCSLIVAMHVFPPDTAIPWFTLLVFVGTALLGKRGGIVVAIVSSAYLSFLPSFLPTVSVSDEAIRASHAMIWAAVALTWITTKPLQTALDWSWLSYEQALAKTKDLECAQGELAGALKRLGETCYRLEVVNLELSRARQAADEARRLKARFAAFLSHELRLPLNIITGFSELMAMSPSSYDHQVLPPAYRSDVESIYRAASHLTELIDDVLDLGAIDAYQLGLQKEWVSLAGIIDQASTFATGLFQSKGLSVEVGMPADLPPVFADGTRIRQVILNLLNNAARYTDRGGARLSVTVNADDVVIAVADTGIGIAPRDLPHVFEEFRQLESAGQRRLGGVGLGLTISKTFVEMHGGNMWVESHMGEGTTFFLSLPLHNKAIVTAGRHPWETWARTWPPSEQQAGVPVAVLGHDLQAIRMLQRYLDGYRLVTVANPDELRRVATEDPVRAVIMCDPPGQEDRRLLSEVLSQLPSIPVITYSARMSRSNAVRSLGVADYLVKPVEREHIASALAALGEVERVVVVDDDPEMARLLVAMIRSLSPHYQVWSAHDGDEALALIDTHRPQAVLLDLLMPGIDGYEVLRRLRSSADLQATPVIVVTAGALMGEGMTAEINTITRDDGLTVAELVRCLRGALDSLLTLPDTDQGQTGALVA